MPAHMLSPKSSNESLQSSFSTISVPDKLAPAVANPMVWEGSELDPTKYVVHLTDRDIQDIRAAVIKVKSEYSYVVSSNMEAHTYSSCRNRTIRDSAGDF